MNLLRAQVNPHWAGWEEVSFPLAQLRGKLPTSLSMLTGARQTWQQSPSIGQVPQPFCSSLSSPFTPL